MYKRQIYGRDISANLLPVETEQNGVHMTGFIGKPIICRGNRSYENYFINGRYIKSPVITQAIEDAYKTFTMVHKFPFAVLHFTLDTAELDVNVHPTKMEVRFSHGQELYKFIYESLRHVLLGKELIPEVKPSEPKKTTAAVRPGRTVDQPTSGLMKHPIEQLTAQTATSPKRTPEPKPDTRPEPKETKEKFPEPFEKKRLETLRASTVEEKPQQYELFETGLLTKEARVRHKLIGQVFETYWIVEYDGKLFIIDQHAAHEKVLYEKLMKRFKENQPMTQMVQPPIILTLSMTEIDLLNRYMDEFKKMGFEFESFGGKEYALRGVPSDLYGFTGKEMVTELLDELAGEFERMRTDVIGDKIATMACKAAVKGNMRISAKEADALIEELLKAENPYTCPHGRPTIISMTKTELEKRFKRIV